MDNAIVNLAAIVGGLVIAMSVIPVILFLNSKGETGEPAAEKQFAWKDEEDI